MDNGRLDFRFGSCWVDCPFCWPGCVNIFVEENACGPVAVIKRSDVADRTGTDEGCRNVVGGGASCLSKGL
jgi:hypothetical protein